MQEESELVSVHTAQGWHLAQIYKSKLEAAEIPVLLMYESAGLVYGITVDGLGAVDILVPAEYADEARVLLKDIEEPTAGVWDDEAPGEVDEPEPEDPV